jgi:hypothetical protein
LHCCCRAQRLLRAQEEGGEAGPARGERRDRALLPPKELLLEAVLHWLMCRDNNTTQHNTTQHDTTTTQHSTAHRKKTTAHHNTTQSNNAKTQHTTTIRLIDLSDCLIDL